MEVTAAIFIKGSKVLLMRRSQGQNAAGGWEYPGGKIELGETGAQCLKRELYEELGIDAEIGELLAESTFATSTKTIHLQAYRVNQYQGEIQLTVHDQMEWVDARALLEHEQLPADYLISKQLVEEIL